MNEANLNDLKNSLAIYIKAHKKLQYHRRIVSQKEKNYFKKEAGLSHLGNNEAISVLCKSISVYSHKIYLLEEEIIDNFIARCSQEGYF